MPPVWVIATVELGRGRRRPDELVDQLADHHDRRVAGVVVHVLQPALDVIGRLACSSTSTL
jgi:hypothetical protein